MKFIVSNIEYNHVKKGLKRLEGAYNQSHDDTIRKAVKEKTYFDLAFTIEGFGERFYGAFETCQMQNLKEIDELAGTVLTQLEVTPLPQIEASTLKKRLKLKEKPMNSFVRGYNESTAKTSLTYYSQQIDEKLVLLHYKDGEFIGVVGDVLRKKGIGQSLCAFCNQFRRGEEIAMVTNNVKTPEGAYSTLGQYICLDHVKCNADILEENKLMDFMTYSGAKERKK